MVFKSRGPRLLLWRIFTLENLAVICMNRWCFWAMGKSCCRTMTGLCFVIIRRGRVSGRLKLLELGIFIQLVTVQALCHSTTFAKERRSKRLRGVSFLISNLLKAVLIVLIVQCRLTRSPNLTPTMVFLLLKKFIPESKGMSRVVSNHFLKDLRRFQLLVQRLSFMSPSQEVSQNASRPSV